MQRCLMQLTRMFGRRTAKAKLNPFRKHVRLLLDDAVRQSATAIVLGIPRDQPWNFDAQLKEEQDGWAEVNAALVRRGEEPEPWSTDDAFLRLPNGASDIPIWFEIGGKLQLQEVSQS